MESAPTEVEQVFRSFRTCEFSTIAKDGTPVTWPTVSWYDASACRFLLATSIGLPDKAFNIRRNPHVSLFFSDPTGSGLTDPPRVLVQGDAEAPDEVVTSSEELRPLAFQTFARQPAARMYSDHAITRWLFDWYYMRLLIHVTPRWILWWDGADQDSPPRELEVLDVG